MAKLLVTIAPFRVWRATLGRTGPSINADHARRLAAQVERAAFRLPFETKCLPRSMALSWRLARRGIAHSVVFAVRPPGAPDGEDRLHAWVEVNGERILGDLPGQWVETLRLGDA